ILTQKRKKLPLKSDSTQTSSLFHQILDEVVQLRNEIKPQWSDVEPLYITNDIDRLSLRYNTFQIFSKILLVTENTYQDILATFPTNPLCESLNNFCIILRNFRNRLIHRPNYVDLVLEEEIKEFIINSYF